MNIPDNTVKQPSLPPLVKGSTTYKLIVPKKVEEKIRYLCRKFPTLEWSGILFTSHKGSFEDGDLVITCQDLYPMDLGTSTYTDFKMDETVAGYIAENIDLFGCDMNLLHSHNQMNCWFSGTDIQTLNSEGNDQNCFVSLIVNNKGAYCAAITRKVQKKTEVVTKSLGTSYEFFGEGEIKTDEDPMSESTKVVDDTVIEYFMLDVEIEHVDNPLAYLDIRFDEIQEAKKKKVTAAPTVVNPPMVKASEDGNHSPWIPGNKRNFGYDFDDDYSFRDYLKNKEKFEELSLFPEDEEDEMIDTSGWEPEPEIIHQLVCQMITCSLIISSKIDLKQWITNWMDKKYKELFSQIPSQFSEWSEFIVDFQINQYIDPTTPDGVLVDMNTYQSKIAKAMYTELCPYSENDYISSYMEILTRYIYE